MRILILGDPHLGGSQNLGKQYAGSTINSRVIDQVSLLDWVLDQAIANNVQHLIITGDIFDEPNPKYQLIILFVEWLQKCIDYSISVHIIAGNHDLLRSGQLTTSSLDILSAIDIYNVFFYKKLTTLYLDDITITFSPFRDRRSYNTDNNSEALVLLQSQISNETFSIGKDQLKILVGHFAMEGSIPVSNELGELANELLCPISMFNEYNYVFMGHIHKFQIISSHNPYIAQTGSMDISNFGEADHKKYITIIDSKSEEKLQYIQLPTRPLKHFVFQLPELNTNATLFVEEELAKVGLLTNCIVKVSIILPTNFSHSIDRNIIEKAIYKAGAFHISKISEERTFTSLKKQINQTIDNTVNELSAIKTYSSLIEDGLREEFVNLASLIVQECKETIK